MRDDIRDEADGEADEMVTHTQTHARFMLRLSKDLFFAMLHAALEAKMTPNQFIVYAIQQQTTPPQE